MGTPVSDAERSIIGLRLGIDPGRLSFNYNNSDYKPIANEEKAPELKDLSVIISDDNKMLVQLKLDDLDSGLTGINIPEVTIQLVTLTLCPQMANKVFQQI